MVLGSFHVKLKSWVADSNVSCVIVIVFNFWLMLYRDYMGHMIQECVHVFHV